MKKEERAAGEITVLYVVLSRNHGSRCLLLPPQGPLRANTQENRESRSNSKALSPSHSGRGKGARRPRSRCRSTHPPPSPNNTELETESTPDESTAGPSGRSARRGIKSVAGFIGRAVLLKPSFAASSRVSRSNRTMESLLERSIRSAPLRHPV